MNRLLKTTTSLIIALAVTCGDRCSTSVADDGVVRSFQPAGRYTLTPSEMAFDNVGGAARKVPFGPRWRANTQVGDGLGWTDGNTFVSGFMPFHINPFTDLVFVEVRGFAAHNEAGNGVGGNVGVGYRRLLEGTSTIVGVSVWGDADGAYQNNYYQVGVSGEVITPVGEVRANGYIAVGGNQSNVVASGATGTPFFQNNFIMLNQQTVTEFQHEGFDAEIGGPLPYVGRYGFSGWVGGYYLKTDGFDGFGGVKLRGEAHVHEDIQLGVEYRHDDTFGNNIWANMTFQFPRSWREWWRKPFFRQRTTVEHLARPVERLYRAQVKTRRVNGPRPLINPLDGQPIYVIHVNPNGPSGNGTFESPFNAGNFTNTSVADIIRVLPGNFSRPGTLTLFNNQRLLAANRQHLFYSTRGVFTLPSQVSGVNPVIYNTAGGNVIQLANNNEVSGFDINGNGTGIGIVGGGIRDFNLNNLNITNATDGIQITNFSGSGLLPPFGQLNQILNVTSSNNTGNGVLLAMNSGGVGTVTIDNLNSGGNAGHGLAVTSTGNSTVNLSLTNSTLGDGKGLKGNGGDGFNLTADSGTANLLINNNLISGNADRGLDFNLTGTAVASISASNNIIGVGGTGSVSVGTSFTGSVFGVDSPFIPPDTMGAVGPSHIAELINGRFTVYDKNGTQLFTSTLDAFWTAAGVTIPAGNSTFDPRILYDPQSGRWFAISIDSGAGNRIYVAVSTSSDPTAGWSGFNFVGDTVNGTRFNDFDTFGIDTNGLYIATNNFINATGVFDSVSLYSIPKASLLGGVPSIAGLARFENQAVATVGFTPQPVVDNGTTGGPHAFISASSSGVLTRTNIIGTGGGPAPTLSGSTNIAVPGFAASPNARQPGPNDNIDTDGDRISGNIVKVGNSFWAAHSVAGPGGTSAIRWYQIDATTNTLVQSGTISDPNLDFYYPSIAVNPTGDVVIGFSGSSDTQFISTYAASGSTSGGTTTFGAPKLLKQGSASYVNLDGIGRNRWGDYSATVVDPTRSNEFWTFQLFASATNTWATQITQLRVGGAGNGTDGWRINLANTAVLQPSTFSNNTFLRNGGTGLNIITSDTAVVQNAIVTSNIFNGNAQGLMLTANNASTINSAVDGNTFTLNTLNTAGFYGLANGGTVNISSLLANIASSNTNGSG
ncbi:MAG: beta strand repeat-containing protein, partial [Planctomycetaceae bacterium]